MYKKQYFPEKVIDIKGLILDLRGTLVDPVHDFEVSDDILSQLLDLGKKMPIAIITAGSLETVKKLFLAKWFRKSTNKDQGIFIYTDSATKGFKVSLNKKILRLKNFSDLTFDTNTLALIKTHIDTARDQFIFKYSLKIKDGQINFYLNKPFKTRLAIAEVLRSGLNKFRFKIPISVNVPSSKKTIDICLMEKARGARDFIGRLHLSPQSVLFVSDSLQAGAADTGLLTVYPSCVSVHVGADRKNILAKYCSKDVSVGGTLEVLQKISF